MPIPHLQHKIHSPNDWEKERPSKIIGRKPIKGRFFDIHFNPKKGQFDWKNLFKRYWPHLIAVILFGCLTLVGLFAWLSKDLPDPNKLVERDVAQSTKIYDRTGEHLLYDIHGNQKRTIISLTEIPSYAVQATLALEDQRFYEHGGFSITGMIRGVILQTLKGKKAQGGSTLTQQLIKNAILTNERSVTRKIKELILAYRIEKKYSKDEILQMYFNEIPYGSTAYGIEAAANYYFGKSAKELTLGEAAVLAALPQAPSYYSPWGSHLDALFGRQQYALDQMVELGYITPEQAADAKAEKITFKSRIEGIIAPHFVFFVKELLAEKYGDALVEQGGWKIISTLDFDLQQQAETIIKEQAEKNLTNFDAGNAALVAIDVKTGQILAMVGSKDFFDDTIDGQVNVAISPRQPGSSFKPIVYTAAFAKGYVPETMVYDLVTNFITPQGPYTPHNYDGQEHGPVSLRMALAGSLNIPAVKMIYLTGTDNVLNLADNLGYTTLGDRSRFGFSLVLGGGEVKLLEHTNAYATLAREGAKMPYSAILKLEDNQKNILEEFQTPHAQKVIEPAIARITSDVLSDNNARSFIFGSSNYLTLGDRPVAAKTGTTNDYHDAWTLGYTPQIAVGVWVGNSDNTAMKKGADGSQIAAPIWQKFMKAANANLPIQGFVKPTYSIPSKPMLGGDAGGVKVKIDKSTGMLATEATPPQLVEEKTFKQAHDILHYVNKEDPLGPIPSDPAKDEQYNAWEEPVAKWAKEHNITNELPPTDQDNLHRLSDRPSLSLISPKDGDTINQATISFQLTASAPRGIQKIEYYFGDKMIGILTQEPFNQSFDLPSIGINGQHNLVVKAYDDLGNVDQAEVKVTIDRADYLNVAWQKPTANSTINRSTFPLMLTINVNQPEKISKADFYYQKPGEASAHWLAFKKPGTENEISVSWSEIPEVGKYKLYPVLIDNNGQTLVGPEININLE
ncbi:MAG: transglycosylase domain-containing protein [Patescibacteria group bacterium]|jgi:1A family penicillin-binding protein